MSWGKYILDESGRPQRCDDVMAWGAWMQTASRHVAVESVGEARISTVFLGLDHAFDGPVPLLYETMVFGGPLDQEQYRYSTREQAEEGHAATVRRVREAAPNPETDP